MKSDGWNKLGDRLEILWGADYLGCYDLSFFKGKGRKDYFSEIPDDFALPTEDKRKEIETSDVEVGLQSIGVARLSRSSV